MCRAYLCLIAASFIILPLFSADSEYAVAEVPKTTVIEKTPARSADYLWRLSLFTMVSANAADTITSIQDSHIAGLHETNPLYGPGFGARGISLKVCITGGQALAEWLVVRHHPGARKWFAVFNFGESVIPASSAYHNASLR